MTEIQQFKANDETERKVKEAFLTFLDPRTEEFDAFYQGAYTCFVLGDVLYALKRDPMAGVITQETFRSSFFAIHNLFTRPGTFEFYLEVFRAVWGEDIEVEFVVPSPGVLQINISGLTIQLENLLARRIVNNAYVYDEITLQGGTYDGDNLVAQGTQGIKTQAQAEALVNEFYPAGLWVETTLIIT